MNQEIQSTTKRTTLFLGICILLVSFFLIPFLGSLALVHLYKISLYTPTAFWFNRLLLWFSPLIAFLFAYRFEKQNFLLYEEKRYNFLLSALSVVGIFLTLFAGLFFIAKTLIALGFAMESERLEKMLLIFRTDRPLVFFTAITAGVVEELVFRGYLLPRLELILKSPVIAILLSSVLFGLMHFGYGTFVQIAAPFFIGLVFAYYYWEFRNIKVLIFCHCAWDVMAIMVRL